MESCPIAATLGTLGRKWAIPILRDIAFFPDASFSLILRNNSGLRQRTLSLRLKQLTGEELIRKSPPLNGARPRKYRLTEKGLQVWPILSALMQFGVQNHAAEVFADGRPRNLEDVFPGATDLMLGRFAPGGMSTEAVRSPGSRSAAYSPVGARRGANRA
jgi:DNA-binding HxlR family transcriptional regulator